MLCRVLSEDLYGFINAFVKFMGFTGSSVLGRDFARAKGLGFGVKVWDFGLMADKTRL